MYKERKKDRELTSIYLDNFFKAKLRAIPKETNKISTLTYKLETMESELKLKKKKKEIFDLSKSRQSWHILSNAVSLPTHPVFNHYLAAITTNIKCVQQRHAWL